MTGQYKITEITGSPELRERLKEMGFYVGQIIEILGRAPFSGPYLVQFEACFIALRDEELKCLSLAQ